LQKRAKLKRKRQQSKSHPKWSQPKRTQALKKQNGGTVEAKQRTVKKQKTPNFAVVDYIVLCKDYVNCTLGPLVGNHQKVEVFWNAVL
jgi:hypothetical protein